VLALGFTSILYAYGRGHQFTCRVVAWILETRLSVLEEETRFPFFRRFILSLAIIFFSVSLFGFAVASGLLKSKEREIISIEEFMEERR
jgi:hypothetical protein